MPSRTESAVSSSRHADRVFVVSRFEAGSLFAHAINTVKMAQGFARLGCRVTLICRRGKGGAPDAGALAEAYGLDTPVDWVCLSAGRWLKRKTWRERCFTAGAMARIVRKRPALVYARDYIVPTMCSRLNVSTVAETHAHPGNESPLFHAVMRATHRPGFCALVTISQQLAEHYRSRGADPSKLLVLPDGVDLRRFARPVDLPPCPYDDIGPRVVYAGHLYDYKGIPTVLAAAVRLPEIRFHFVGGWDEDLARHRARARELRLSNVTFHGLLPQTQLPPYLWHADVLLLPPSAAHPSAAWTSPVKLGEYLAAQVPVVASDIPALRDRLNDQQAEFFEPDDGASLAGAIQRVLDDPARRRALVDAGWRLAQTMSYTQRARRILEHARLG